MNAQRRKQIEALKTRIAEITAAAELLRDDVQNIIDEEQEYLDGMPESFQDGQKGEKAQAAIDALQYAYDEIDQFASAGDDLSGYLDTAAE